MIECCNNRRHKSQSGECWRMLDDDIRHKTAFQFASISWPINYISHALLSPLYCRFKTGIGTPADFSDVDSQANNKAVAFRSIDPLWPAQCGGFSSLPFWRTRSSRSIHSARSMKCLPRPRRLGHLKQVLPRGPAAACEPNLTLSSI